MPSRKLLFLLFIPFLSYSQPAVQWRKAVKNGIQSINSAVAICADKSGSVTIVGNTHEIDSLKKIFIVRLDSSGNEIWRRIFQPEERTEAIAVALAVDLSGNTVVSGTVRNKSGNTDILTLKYSPEGILLWQNIYAGKANLFDAPAAIAVDKKGNILVCGHETASESNPDLLLIRYSASGETSFIKNFSTPQMDAAVDVAVDDSCNIYVGGNINVSTRTADIIVMKFDSVGNPKWNYVYDGDEHAVDLTTDIILDDSTNIYITGTANHSNDKSDIPLIKLNRNGKLVSSQLFSDGVADGTGNKLWTSGKIICMQATFTDYLQQSVNQYIYLSDKNCKQKHKFKSSEDVTYLKAAGWGINSTLLFGSVLTRPENTIAPYIEITDSLYKTRYTFHDPVLISLLRIKDVLLAGRDVYFLGDDAAEIVGTISVVKYSFPDKSKNKPKVTNPIKK